MALEQLLNNLIKSASAHCTDQKVSLLCLKWNLLLSEVMLYTIMLFVICNYNLLYENHHDFELMISFT